MSESPPFAPALEVEESFDVRGRLTALECGPLSGLAVLPRNLETAVTAGDLVLVSEAATITKLFEAAGLPISRPLQDKRPSYALNRSAGWIGPTIFISAGLITQQPEIVSVALGVLTNYLTDFLKGGLREKPVRLEIVVEREGNQHSKKLSYEGPVSGLAALQEPIERLSRE